MKRIMYRRAPRWTFPQVGVRLSYQTRRIRRTRAAASSVSRRRPQGDGGSGIEAVVSGPADAQRVQAVSAITLKSNENVPIFF